MVGQGTKAEFRVQHQINHDVPAGPPVAVVTGAPRGGASAAMLRDSESQSHCQCHPVTASGGTGEPTRAQWMARDTYALVGLACRSVGQGATLQEPHRRICKSANTGCGQSSARH